MQRPYIYWFLKINNNTSYTVSLTHKIWLNWHIEYYAKKLNLIIPNIIAYQHIRYKENQNKEKIHRLWTSYIDNTRINAYYKMHTKIYKIKTQLEI